MSSQYFKSRAEAGRILADKLVHYANEPCYIVALSEGSVIVAAQIAMKVHATIGLLLTGDQSQAGNINALSSLGSERVFNYNMRPAGSFEFDQTDDGGVSRPARGRAHNYNALLGHDGDIHRKLLHQHVVIVVSDGFNSGESLEIAGEFLQSTVLKRLIVATPVASFEALNRIHVMADEVICLRTEEIFQGTDHYFEDNTIPPLADLFEMVSRISLAWKR